MCFIPRRLYIFIFIAFYESRFSLANESPPAKTAPAAIDNSKQFHNGDLSHHLERTARQFQSSQNTVYNPASGSNWNQPENNYYNQWNTPYSNSGQNNVNQWSDTNEGSGSAPSSHSTYPDQWGYEDQWDIEQNSGDGPIEIGSGEHPDTEKAWETPAIVPVDNGDIKFDNDYMELSPTTTTTGYDQPDIDIIKHVPLEPKVLPIPPEEEVRTTSATTQAPEIITDSGREVEPNENDISVGSDETEPVLDNFWRKVSEEPGLLAAVIGGACIGLLCAILLAMFLVYRMRKKDEGSYALDEPALYRKPGGYMRAPTSDTAISKEYYA